MEGLDDGGLFFSDNFSTDDASGDNQAARQQVKKRMRNFLREYHEGNFAYTYRDQLKRHHNLGQQWLQVDVADLDSFDMELAEKLIKSPSEHMPLFEEAAKEVALDILSGQQPPTAAEVQAGSSDPSTAVPTHEFQVLIRSGANVTSFRELKSDQIAQLVKISGIVIAASSVKSKATHITIQCRSCRNTLNNIPLKPGLEGYALPRKCNSQQGATGAGARSAGCPIDPYFILPDKCKCVDYQILKLQEAPESVPMGEMPRHVQLYCDRYLCERVVPGNRVTVTGMYAIKKSGVSRSGKGGNKSSVGVRQPYMRVFGIEIDTLGSGRAAASTSSSAAPPPVSPEDEAAFRRLAERSDIYAHVAKSIAPSIYGSDEIKKAIACMLFGGSRKRLPDGLMRRGDINVLLLGDPGTAKSQLLKFVEQCSPIAVYTSGKGSSAAGLTASVTRDSQSRNFVVEGGAMVLADGGVVCIDEFDKMREDDRVAIHEAMEQQTISIAKAGITTTLNTRCSVLAAANSIYGRWDDSKGSENIDFMPTILSRFDMIFVVKDQHNEDRDIRLAKHVMNIHMNLAVDTAAAGDSDEIPLPVLKKYIAYCRSRCGPRISADAAEKLKNQYVLMRGGAGQLERDTGKKSAIPITVRQLEAIVRMSEALAKMRLAPFATESDVDEALRLFRVSTLDAASTGTLSGAEGFATQEDQEVFGRIEKQVKRRFVIGAQVSEHAIVQDFLKQKYPEHAIFKCLNLMLKRGEIQYRAQRKMLYRVK